MVDQSKSQINFIDLLNINKEKYDKIKTRIRSGTRESIILKELVKEFYINEIKVFWSKSHLQIIFVNILFICCFPTSMMLTNIHFISILYESIFLAWGLSLIYNGYIFMSIIHRSLSSSKDIKIQIRKIECSSNYHDFMDPSYNPVPKKCMNCNATFSDNDFSCPKCLKNLHYEKHFNKYHLFKEYEKMRSDFQDKMDKV